MQATTRWLPLEAWDALETPAEDLTGHTCWGGLDLAATTDLAALAWYFPGEPARTVMRFWTPQAMVDTLDLHTGGLATAWARDGQLTVIPGDTIDYDIIHAQIAEDAQRYDVRDIGIDRWNSQATINYLTGAGLPVTGLSQGFALSGAMQELEKQVRAQTIAHDGDPVLRWCVNCAEVRRGNDERIRLVKPYRGASATRVDGVAALTMAIDRWLGRTDPKPADTFDFYTL